MRVFRPSNVFEWTAEVRSGSDGNLTFKWEILSSYYATVKPKTVPVGRRRDCSFDFYTLTEPAYIHTCLCNRFCAPGLRNRKNLHLPMHSLCDWVRPGRSEVKTVHDKAIVKNEPRVEKKLARSRQKHALFLVTHKSLTNIVWRDASLRKLYTSSVYQACVQTCRPMLWPRVLPLVS